MRADEYIHHDAVGLRELMVSGEVTADEVEAAARTALDEADARVNGLAAPPFTPALGHDPDGPLAGVPFLYKDVGPMAAGVPFHGGSRAVPDIRPDHDSDLMRRVRAAGLKTLGVTTTPELGMSLTTEPLRTGPTRNPFDPERSAGGSSGGSAALVAAGAVPIAHGSDGAGSLRVPAACCGVIGLKPTRGRIPCGPDIGEALFGLSEHFAVTRTVRDTAALLDVLHGPCAGDKYTAPPPRRSYADEVGADPGRLRVALWTDGAQPEATAAAEAAARVLAGAGHAVEAQAPPLDDDAVARMLEAGLAVAVEPFLRAPRLPPANRVEAMTNRSIADLQTLGALELMDAFAAQNRVSRAVGAFFEHVDVVVSPTLPGPPAKLGELDYDDPRHTRASWIRSLLDYSPFTAVFNVTGQPAISLPLARDASGLPIGVQLVAAYGGEDVLLRLASQLMPQ
jgi:amidase